MIRCMTEETAEEKIARYEYVLDAYVRELTALREENARLREGAGALATLQALYRDPDLSQSLRAKCAIGCLPHEEPRQPPEPLSALVERQRKRADAMLQEPPFSDLPKLISRKGNGNDTDSSD